MMMMMSIGSERSTTSEQVLLESSNGECKLDDNDGCI
jgi:hypothetical protein